MVQHIRKKHPEFAQLPNTIHAPLATAVISSTPAVLTTDSTTGETVVVRIQDVLDQANGGKQTEQKPSGIAVLVFIWQTSL